MHYQESLSLAEARQQYFAVNGFDGAYSERWVKLKAGPLTFGFPNAAGRVRAVKLHDLHHVVTGYDTSWTGEAEIAAWELASGCGKFVWAWLLNVSALGIGLVIAPGRVWRAFVRGRRSRNLYREEGELREATLQRSVGEMRRLLELDRPAGAATLGDAVGFAACAVVSLLPLAVAVWLIARAV